MVTRDGFPELLPSPVRGRVSRDVVVEHTAAADLYHDEDQQPLESDRHRNQKITGHDLLGMIPDEGHPVLGCRSFALAPVRLFRPILANRSRGNQNAQLEREFVGNALFAPSYVLLHLRN